MQRIPNKITDQTILFFVEGRPYDVKADNPVFNEVKTILLAQTKGEEVDTNRLIDLVTPKRQIENAFNGLLEIRETNVGSFGVFLGDKELHNFWVQQITTFRQKGEDYSVLWNALSDLLKNPDYETVAERLPLFIEKSNLYFLPDGRFVAFKGVKQDYFDIHTGHTHQYKPGSIISEDRSYCDNNHHSTCSRGLHVGTMTYIQSNGYGWDSNRRMVLCAIWPRDVVAVPDEYQSGKMRVCSLEVLDEVNQEYANSLFGVSVVRNYDTSATTPVHDDVVQTFPIGSMVVTDQDEVCRIVAFNNGSYKLESYDYTKNTFTTSDENYSEDELTLLPNTKVVEAAFNEASHVTVQYHPVLRDGSYRVSNVEVNQLDEQDVEAFTIFVGENDTEFEIANKYIVGWEKKDDN